LLNSLAKFEKQHLGKFVLVENCIIDISPLASDKDYIDVNFSIHNLSMYSVSIPAPDGTVIENPIYFNGELLSRGAKLFNNEVRNISPTKKGSFTIRQWVDSEHATKIVETLKKSGNLFNFSEAVVRVSIDGDTDNGAKLDLTRGMQNAALEKNIKELESLIPLHQLEISEWRRHVVMIAALNRVLGMAEELIAIYGTPNGIPPERIEEWRQRLDAALRRCYGAEGTAKFYNFPYDGKAIEGPKESYPQERWFPDYVTRLQNFMAEQTPVQLVADKAETQKQ
jgi:hypothetical protein